MEKWQQDVLEFHRILGVYIGQRPRLPDPEVRRLRARLIREEAGELLSALESGSLVGIASESADLIVVVLGTCISCGIDLEPVWDEVHKSNMAKAGGPRREDGKVLKPEGWKSPKIAEVLLEQIDRV